MKKKLRKLDKRRRYSIEVTVLAILDLLGDRNPLALDDDDLAAVVSAICPVDDPADRLEFASVVLKNSASISDVSVRLIVSRVVESICLEEYKAIRAIHEQIREVDPDLFTEHLRFKFTGPSGTPRPS